MNCIITFGVVLVLIELLLNVLERRECELMLVALDRLCECAEGRAELLNDGAGLAVVSKKVLKLRRGLGRHSSCTLLFGRILCVFLSLCFHPIHDIY